MDCLCPAHQLAATRNFLTSADVQRIHDLAAVLPENALVVDLGAGSGTTALSVWQTCPTAQIHTFDSSPDAINWTREAIKNVGKLDRWTPYQCNSWDSVPLGDIDLLLIDASHEYEDVFSDFYAWRLQVKHGAPVWFHDYTDLYPGVQRLVDMLIKLGHVVNPQSGEGEWGITTYTPAAQQASPTGDKA